MTGKLSSETLRSWHELYQDALLEMDVRKLPLRIQEARRALVLRSREVFSVSPHGDEAEAIEAAMYGLNALESCVRLKTKDRRHIPKTA